MSTISAIPQLFATGLTGLTGLTGILQTGKSNFTDLDSAMVTTIIIIRILSFVISIILSVATYRLTGSTFQALLCLFFGCFYLVCAFLYYGFSGYKLKK
jgi:hypothetical protein